MDKYRCRRPAAWATQSTSVTRSAYRPDIPVTAMMKARRQGGERLSSVRQMFLNIDLREQFMGIPVDLGFGFNLKTYNVELDERFSRFISLNSVNRTMPVSDAHAATEWSPLPSLTLYPGFTTQFTLDMPITFEPRIRIAWQPGQSSRTQISLAAGKYVQTHSGYQ